MTEQQSLTKVQQVDVFLSSGEQFVEAVKSMPQACLDASAAPGEWTIRQIVHHVADDGDVWSFALKKAVGCPGAPVRFEGFPGNEPWADALGFDQRPVAAALDLIRAHRKMMAEVALYAEDWDACFMTGYDDQGNVFGKLNVGQILQMLTSHMLEHLSTVQAIIK